MTLVGHNPGSALRFYWARRNSKLIREFAYMEVTVRPLSWKESPEEARAIFQAMRSKEGEELVFEANAFVEVILPPAVLRELTEEETVRGPTLYRRPPARDRRGSCRFRRPNKEVKHYAVRCAGVRRPRRRRPRHP